MNNTQKDAPRQSEVPALAFRQGFATLTVNDKEDDDIHRKDDDELGLSHLNVPHDKR